MNKILVCISFLPLLASCGSSEHSPIIKTTEETLMHEVRATPFPLDGAVAQVNPPRFMWPDKFPHLGAVLDGVGENEQKPVVTYRIRISQDKTFKKEVLTGEQPWAFFNPFQPLAKGVWYWQHAYVTPEGQEEWSPVYQFSIDRHTPVFNPPSLEKILSIYSTRHPRVLMNVTEWDDIIERNKQNPEAIAYIRKASQCLSHPLKPLYAEIDTTNVVKLTNQVQRKSALIRESRKIVDREEANVESLVRAYLLTKDKRFYQEGMKRLAEILSWQDSKYFAGDFNLSTLLSMSTSAYDGFYGLLTPDEKQLLLHTIRTLGNRFYQEYVNHLENRIADNHVWQMTYRILTMAAFATVGEIPEASIWTNYCYNEWISRLPGLNDDGAWHNGDSYFHVNIRTLIEVPVFFSHISGFDFFADPWYRNNVLYVIYQQPPFSKSGGHGNSHEGQRTPSGARVGYADALARECNDPWAAAYVHEILREDSAIFSKAFEAKPSDLRWYRCTTKKAGLPYTVALSALPDCKVFKQTGTALMNTDLGHYARNARVSFRSSPYGSTSHALANQNTFNTFYGGKAIFYSSGHRTGFTDDHCMYAYRNTRAHNGILVNGMGQKIGTEGYGWIPRYYEGEEISYVVGDASNAYGQVTSPLWLERGRLSGTEYTPEKGWDVNRLSFFRRHLVQLGRTGLFVVYDELEGKEEVKWDYLLHTLEQPMKVTPDQGGLRVIGKNNSKGISVAHLFASQPIDWQQTDTFFVAAVDWKKRLGKKLNNHFHFRATSQPAKKLCFLNVLDVHGDNREDMQVVREGNRILVGDWIITCNLDGEQPSFLRIENCKQGTLLDFNYAVNHGATKVVDHVKGQRIEQVLVDSMPQLDI
ncbi:Heparinase II/III-like protein [gut metagenome]|uniref:Heparinase II/III-like protein n=1 Tax=gut metagenome TaxID=749906 RepID=J9FI56_9ZZZZ